MSEKHGNRSVLIVGTSIAVSLGSGPNGARVVKSFSPKWVLGLRLGRKCVPRTGSAPSISASSQTSVLGAKVFVQIRALRATLRAIFRATLAPVAGPLSSDAPPSTLPRNLSRHEFLVLLPGDLCFHKGKQRNHGKSTNAL